MLELSVIVAVPAGSNVIPPVVDPIVFPLIVILPVEICVGLTIVVLVPSVNVIPVKLVTSKFGVVKLTAPVLKFTENKSPTLKFPAWSTLL